jgi:hypothetical protein
MSAVFTPTLGTVRSHFLEITLTIHILLGHSLISTFLLYHAFKETNKNPHAQQRTDLNVVTRRSIYLLRAERKTVRRYGIQTHKKWPKLEQTHHPCEKTDHMSKVINKAIN